MKQIMNDHLENVIIRAVNPTDYDSIYKMYSYYIENSDNNWNYQPRSYDLFAAHFEEMNQIGRPFLVAIKNNSVVGYGALHAFRSAAGYWPCVENSVYVSPGYHGQGIGRQLMRALIEQAKSCGLWSIVAVIDSGNESSIRFHEKSGFVECGRMNNIGEKNHHALSAVFMQYDIPVNRDRYLAKG